LWATTLRSGAAIGRDRHTFEPKPTKNEMAYVPDTLARGLDIVIAPHRGEFGAGRIKQPLGVRFERLQRRPRVPACAENRPSFTILR